MVTAVVPTPVTVNPYPRCGMLMVSFTTTSEVFGLIATGIEVVPVVRPTDSVTVASSLPPITPSPEELMILTSPVNL